MARDSSPDEGVGGPSGASACNGGVARSRPRQVPHSTRAAAPRRVLADRACKLHCCSDESAAAAAAGRLDAQITIPRAARAWDP